MPHRTQSRNKITPPVRHVTVDAVEEATGLNFFSKVPKEEQERLERTINVKAWKGLKK